MSNNSIRQPAFAGSFYPGDPVELSKTIADFFADTPKQEVDGEIVGLVSPHAGYIYSGGVAAVSYKLLEGDQYDTVVVIAPSHAAYFDGVSAFPGDTYNTPLGPVEVDNDIVKELTRDSGIITESYDGHTGAGGRAEHSLEVQLPFLQIVLPKFRLVPLVMGNQSYETCRILADDLNKALKNKNALVVASTDLSHFHPTGEAGKLDSAFIEYFEAYRPKELAEALSKRSCEACGGGPVVALMLYAQHLGNPRAKKLMYRDSSAVSGDTSNVVGYLSGVITI
ncbi:MAG: AmmeMemoRadiSam system protein B [candidate division Zixibacteria bacterium]|nr:AmmeMemoRadiSam system protein B [candidate division Zixibacteria bacterium]